MTTKQFINPDGLLRPGAYTPVVVASGGRTVYIAGQVSQNEKGEIVGRNDLAAQADQAYRNLGIALRAAGATFDDLVKLTVYVVNFQPEHRDLLSQVRARHVNRANPPASTLVGVQSLAKPEYLVEVEGIAVIDQG